MTRLSLLNLAVSAKENFLLAGCFIWTRVIRYRYLTAARTRVGNRLVLGVSSTGLAECDEQRDLGLQSVTILSRPCLVAE